MNDLALKKQTRKKRKWIYITLALLSVIILPYGWSRLASSGRMLSVHSVLGSAPAAKAPDSNIRVACYNIAHGRGLTASNFDGGDRAVRQRRLDEIAELLREIDADVVVLNEVDFAASWSYSVNQARYLAQKAGYPHWVEQRNTDVRALFWKLRYGNAILSKYPIADAQVIDYPGYSGWETTFFGQKRGVYCDVEIGGQTVRVVGAHLCHRSEDVRTRSAAVLNKLTAASEFPVIVAGDLNSTAPGMPKAQFDADGANAVATFDGGKLFRRITVPESLTEADMTFHSAKPGSVIDWILIPPTWSFQQYRVIQSDLSDHRPVWAELKLSEPRKTD